MTYLTKSLLLSALLILGLSNSAKATHTVGGDISYECVGQDSFLISLSLFRDCSGASLSNIATVNFTSDCGVDFSQNLVSQSFKEVSAICLSQMSNSTCNGGLFAGLEKQVYSGIVVLGPACTNWTLSWGLCCRNNMITNLSSAATVDILLFTNMYSIGSVCNNSPSFNADVFPTTCLNKSVDYNFGAHDPDGDSLVYFMSPGYQAATSLVPYSGTFTFLQPISGANAVLDSSNGQLTFSPTAIGVYVVVIRVEEYDRLTGVMKGNSIRDIQITVNNCTNNSPEVDSPGIYNYSGDGVLVDSNTINVCNGDSFSFDYAFSDLDILDSITVTHNIYQVLDSTAVVSFSGTDPIVVNVTWQAKYDNKPIRYIQLRAQDSHCPFPGVAYGVIKIEIEHSTWAGLDQTICAGSQWVNVAVNGGSSFTWTTISGSPIDTIVNSPNFNMTCWHCDNPSVSPQVTTTYVVYSNFIGGCSSIDTVVVNVAPDFSLTLSGDTTLCPLFETILFANTSNNTLSYNYTWNTGNVADTLPSLNLTLPKTRNYVVTVTSATGCEKVESIQIDLLKNFPVLSYIQGDTMLCIGESGNLELVFGESQPSSCGIGSQSCMGVNSSGVIGNGTTLNSNTSFPAPYSNFYWGSKHQILFTASEMHAMGMVSGGRINAIYFDVASIGITSQFNNFEIKMGCTSSSDLSVGWETGLVTVLPGYSHLITTGWNQHIFTDAYNWDGISNVVVEICFHNTSWNSAGSALSYYTPTTFQSVRYYHADNATVCSSTSSTATSVNRPNIKFDYCSVVDLDAISYVWSPSATMDSVNSLTPIVTPLLTTNYQVIIQDTGGHCADTLFHQVQVVSIFNADFAHQSPYCLNDSTDALIPQVLGGVFSGVGVSSSGIFDPASAGVGTWPINYYISTPVACANDTFIFFEVLPLPDASFSVFEVCIGSTFKNLNPVLQGGTWWGIGMDDSLSGNFNPTNLGLGNYVISHLILTNCPDTATQTVRIIEPYNFTLPNTIISICQGISYDLSSVYQLSSNPNQGTGPVKEIWSDAHNYVDSNGVFDASLSVPGDYTVTLTIEGIDGSCGSTQSFTVKVIPLDFAELLENDFCVNQTSAKLYVSPWLYGTGVTMTQNPLSPLGPKDTLVITPFGQNGQFTPSLRGVGHWEMTLNYTNAKGCTGIVIDTVHVLNAPDTAVDYLGTTLVSKAGIGYQYQWVDCNNNMNPIAGATNASFTPTVQGNYAVQVSAGTCTDMSGCFLTWPLGIENSEIDLGIKIYPNPVTEQLHIDVGINQNVGIEILDAKGKIVWAQKSKAKISTIDMSHLAAGMYVIKLTANKIIQTQRIMKK